jgi:hypothetical protein
MATALSSAGQPRNPSGIRAYPPLRKLSRQQPSVLPASNNPMTAEPIMPEILLNNVWVNITRIKYEKSAKNTSSTILHSMHSEILIFKQSII